MTAHLPGTPAHMLDHAKYYIGQLGWGLCRIPEGTKGPRDPGWNSPRLYIDTLDKADAGLGKPGYGLGLIHEPSGTCAIDVDNVPYFNIILAEFGFELDALFAGAPRVIGRDGRDKAIFRLPTGLPAHTHKLVWPANAEGGKPITVFEFRAGAVQDALPPTIHPDLQRPYTWRVAPWELGNVIPELPKPLAEIWKAWPSLKPQLEAACPWAQPVKSLPAFSPQRSTSSDHQNVIGEFNKAHDLRTMLAHYGYVQKGRRYLAPTSSSGLAGVNVFEDGQHCFSHHASDPLNDGHKHDVFDLFCKFEHHGDTGSAIRAAARLLGIENKRPEVPAVDATPLLKSAKHKRVSKDETPVFRKSDVSPPPPELLTLPGVLGDVVAYANATAPKPQPLFAVTAALALGSVVLGRRWTTPLNTWSSLYFVNVGKSACGKEHARTVIERILTAAELPTLLGPSGYTSDAAIFSSLMHQPTHLAVIDEFGDMLASAKAEGNFHKRQAITLLLEAWGRVSGTLRAQGYSTMTLAASAAKELAKRKIERPALSLLGMTTPDNFYASLDESSIRNGFLNRLLIVETNIGRQAFGEFSDVAVPGSVVQWCREARNGGAGNLQQFELGADIIPEARMVPVDASAMAAWTAYAADCLAAMDNLDELGMAELEGRSAEKAMRLALILAVSDNVHAPVIRSHHIDYAVSFVRFSTEQTIQACQTRMHGSKLEASAAKVLDFISKHGAVCIKTLLQKCRAYSGLVRQQREEVLLTLQDAHRIESIAPDESKGRGRAGKWFRAVCEAEFAE